MSDVATCRTCGLPRFNGPAGYAGAQCLCQWKGATLPKMYDELMAKNAALEAENARLVAEVEELDDLRKRQSELLSAAAIAIRGPEPALTRYSHADIPERVKMVVADRDAAIAQLAAIQGGMGEVVEVVAYLLPDYAICRRLSTCSEMKIGEPLMTVAQHQRITAAMAAEVERLSRMLNNATNDGIKLADERDALAAELAITRRVIDRIGQLCTTPHESKERFIRRVQSVIEWERAAQQEQPQ